VTGLLGDAEAMAIDRDKLGEQLLATFHAQFAENQRVKEQSFLQIAGYLGAIIFGYAYVYHNLRNEIPTLSFVTMAAALLLAFGALVVVVISYNWRRDQLVNARIRRLAGVLGTTSAFPESYDPVVTLATKNSISWMPNLLAVFYTLFPVFQVLLVASYAARIGARFTLAAADPYLTVTCIVWIVCMAATCYAPAHFNTRLRSLPRPIPEVQNRQRDKAV
jgi:hypothetical protein